jgi:SAM-dependent methyltransferase
VAADRWTGGDDYEAYVGRWSRAVGARFVDWLEIPPGRRWADVGCGTGALTAAILAGAAPRDVVGVDPSAEFVAAAASRFDDPRARLDLGSAANIPIEDGWADVVVSGLVLNFVEDLPAALREMLRVTRPQAIIAGYVWDYAGEMQLIRSFWDAAVELDPTAAASDEGIRFPICAPEPLRRAFAGARLANVEVRSIDVATTFRDFDDYWSPFLNGVGPAPGYAAGLDDTARNHLRERLRATLPTEPDGSIHLVARAWAVRGQTPEGPSLSDEGATETRSRSPAPRGSSRPRPRRLPPARDRRPRNRP